MIHKREKAYYDSAVTRRSLLMARQEGIFALERLANRINAR
jgi:hypothetical protein